MSRKVSLAGALGDLTLSAAAPTTEPATEERAPKDPEAAPGAPATAPARNKTATATPRRTNPEAPKTQRPDREDPPRYLQLTRKETRLREDQAEDLNRLARRLSRLKTPGGERITDNTLIRVAVDLLLERSDQLAGTTEDELRNSVTS